MTQFSQFLSRLQNVFLAQLSYHIGLVTLLRAIYQNKLAVDKSIEDKLLSIVKLQKQCCLQY